MGNKPKSTLPITVLIQSIRRSHVTRGPKSTKSGKATGHRSWQWNPQWGWENAKLCLQLNLMSIFLCLMSLITAFSSIKKNYRKTGQLACSLMKISSGHTFLGNAMKPKFHHIGHRSQQLEDQPSKPIGKGSLAITNLNFNAVVEMCFMHQTWQAATGVHMILGNEKHYTKTSSVAYYTRYWRKNKMALLLGQALSTRPIGFLLRGDKHPTAVQQPETWPTQSPQLQLMQPRSMPPNN